MIRILLVDDQNLVQQGIKSLLDRDSEIEVVGTVTDGRSAVTKISELRPDVVLLDIEMPGMNGITVTKYLTHLVPQTKVIILSSHEETKYLTQALMAGAKAYILKSSLMTDLRQSIIAVNNGYSHIESRLLAKIFDPSNLKSASKSNSKKSSSQEPQTVAKTSTIKPENAVSKTAAILVNQPSSKNLANAVTLDPSGQKTRKTNVIPQNQTSKTVPKINLPYTAESNVVDSTSEAEPEVGSQMVSSSATESTLLSSPVLSNSAPQRAVNVDKRYYKTFRVAVKKKKHLQLEKASLAVVKYKTKLNQFWKTTVSSSQPFIDRSRAKIAEYQQKVRPLLAKWQKQSWLARLGFGILGLVAVILIHIILN
ncbi:MAG: response regulator transcription factor [Cyanobacteria bacterium J06600_6]